MINDIIKNEKELQATLKTIKDLTEEHSIFALKGMIPQLEKLIRYSELVVEELYKWNKNNNLERNDEENNMEL
jgi:16S rRNA G527 N7-methylase RsmG